MKKELELYLHIPFCVKKCAYCDFLSAPADEDAKQEYVNALLCEIQGYEAYHEPYQVTTIFMGGGTPSLLTPCIKVSRLQRMRKSQSRPIQEP